MIKKFIAATIIFSGMLLSIIFAHTFSSANSDASQHVPLFSNHKTNIWEETIYPNPKQKLMLHRHNYDRVLVALSDGVLKMTNANGQSHLIKITKNNTYYLLRDAPQQLHTDENISGHPIKMIVIELLCDDGE